MKKRQLSYDCIRIVACIMVVLMHSESAGIGTPGLLLCGLNFVTSPCIGLFFMLSGALLLNNAQNNKQAYSLSEHLRKRMPRLVIPLAFWLVAGEILNRVGLYNVESSILWFMWPLIGMYLLVPILSRWLNAASRSEEEFYLGIWSLSLLYPWIRLCCPLYITDSSWLYYFSGYLGYFVLGHFLAKYRLQKREITSLIVLSCLFCLLAPLGVLYAGIDVSFQDLFWYLSPSSVLQCIIWFVLFQHIESWLQNRGVRFKSVVVSLSSLTFGIYLTHTLFMSSWLWSHVRDFVIYGPLQILVCSGISFAFSALLTYLLLNVPYMRKTVGG